MHLARTETGAIVVSPDPNLGSDAEDLARETSQRARKVVESAKSAIATYALNKSPSLQERTELAAHAFRLAKLDSMARACHLDPSFEMAEREDVEDLLAMLAIVPFDSLLH